MSTPLSPTKKPSAKKPALTTVRVELSIDCGRCSSPLVLECVGERATCRACLHERTFAPEDWAYMAREALDQTLETGRDPRRLRTSSGDPYDVRARIGGAAAVCACGTAIGVEALLSAIGSAVPCPCGRSMPVRAPDERVLAMAPRAVAIANERVAAKVAAEPVAFRCACGASLRADGLRRSVPCVACGPVDVPEPLWNLLRPVVARSPMFLVIAGKRGAR